MTDPLSMSAEQILKARALDLFSAEATLDGVFRSLAKKWHPDKSREAKAEEVFAWITAKLAEAKKAFSNGGYPNTLSIKNAHYPFLATRTFELGEVYIGERHIIWASRRSEDDLAKRWLETVKGFKFPNSDIKNKLEKFLPRNSHTIAQDDRAYTIIDRPCDFIRVADILQTKGPMDPKHVAWVLSRAYNLAGFLSYNHITHLDISPETFFIEPTTHFGALLGGWYYTGVPKPIAAPGRTAHLADNEAAADAQIRIMGRRLFGAKTSYDLRQLKNIPPPIKAWLSGTPKRNIVEAESGWKDTIIQAFGERKFTELKLTTADIYSA